MSQTIIAFVLVLLASSLASAQAQTGKYIGSIYSDSACTDLSSGTDQSLLNTSQCIGVAPNYFLKIDPIVNSTNFTYYFACPDATCSAGCAFTGESTYGVCLNAGPINAMARAYPSQATLPNLYNVSVFTDNTCGTPRAMVPGPFTPGACSYWLQNDGASFSAFFPTNNASIVEFSFNCSSTCSACKFGSYSGNIGACIALNTLYASEGGVPVTGSFIITKLPPPPTQTPTALAPTAAQTPNVPTVSSAPTSAPTPPPTTSPSSPSSTIIASLPAPTGTVQTSPSTPAVPTATPRTATLPVVPTASTVMLLPFTGGLLLALVL